MHVSWSITCGVFLSRLPLEKRFLTTTASNHPAILADFKFLFWQIQFPPQVVELSFGCKILIAKSALP
jgi:hypothetical protein